MSLPTPPFPLSHIFILYLLIFVIPSLVQQLETFHHSFVHVFETLINPPFHLLSQNHKGRVSYSTRTLYCFETGLDLADTITFYLLPNNICLKP